MNPQPAADPSLEERVKALETKAEQKPGKDVWDKLQAISGFVSGLVLAVIGYYFTDSMNLRLQERQFQFSSAKDMQDLLTKLNDPTVSLENKQSTALVLAAFGKYAIDPLVNQMQSGDANRLVAAEAGLRAIGHSDPQSTCDELQRVIENRTQIFSWYTHRSATRLLRETGCRDTLPALDGYAPVLADAQKFASVVHPDYQPTEESLDLMREELKQARASLTGTSSARK
jgi:hypothetical protein